MAGLLKHAYRYQDDVNILNYPNARQHFDSNSPSLCIYPMDLISIKDTTLQYEEINGQKIGTELTFLSVRLALQQAPNGTFWLHTKRYEKVRELPFDVVKFTHRTSTVPQQSLCKIIGTHLSNTAFVSSHITYLLDEIAILMTHLQHNALQDSKIKREITAWANNTAPTLPLRYDIANLRMLLNIVTAAHLRSEGE